MESRKSIQGHDNDKINPAITAGLNVDLEGDWREELTLENDDVKLYTVRCKIDAKVTVTGNSTGNVYEFPRAGAVVEVAEADLEAMLNKRLGGRLCCGDQQSNFMFELA